MWVGGDEQLDCPFAAMPGNEHLQMRSVRRSSTDWRGPYPPPGFAPGRRASCERWSRHLLGACRSRSVRPSHAFGLSSLRCPLTGTGGIPVWLPLRLGVDDSRCKWTTGRACFGGTDGRSRAPRAAELRSALGGDEFVTGMTRSPGSRVRPRRSAPIMGRPEAPNLLGGCAARALVLMPRPCQANASNAGLMPSSTRPTFQPRAATGQVSPRRPVPSF